MRGFRKLIPALVLVSALVLTPTAGEAQVSDARVKHALQVLEVGGKRQAIDALKKIIAESPKLAEAHAVLAMAYLENNQVDLALNAAQTAFDIDRKSVVARQARAMVYGRQGRVEDALKEFYQAIKLNDKEIGSYLALSRYYLTLGPDSLKSAEVMLYRAQAINDKDVRSYLGLGELYEKQRIPDLAISQYESAKKLDPKDVTVGAKLAALYFRDRRYTESINEWINVIRIDSTFSQAYYQIGRLYFLAEQYANAVGYLERYVGMEPEDLEGYWLLAQALTEAGQYSRATPYLEKLAVNDSLKQRSQLLLAKSYFASKEFDKAIAIYRQSNNLDNADRDFYARALLLSGDSTGAVDQFQLALVSDTERTETARVTTRKTLAQLLLALKRGKEAADVFKQLVIDKPSVENWTGLAYYYAQAQLTEEALKAYDSALARDPENLKIHIAIAQTLAGKDPAGAAMHEAFSRVLKLAEKQGNLDAQGQANGWIGYHYNLQKKYQDALPHLDNALKQLDEKSAFRTNVHLMLAGAHHNLKNLKEAEKHYKEVLRRDPNNKAAKEGLEILRKANGK